MKRINKLSSFALLLFFMSITLLPNSAMAKSSACFGTTANGRLENGVRLPLNGNNFTTYSHLAHGLGRTYVHSEVKEIILDAYQALEQEQPEKVFKYAETGFEKGGIFKPHKTHQNGLSVDFMTPVMNTEKNTKGYKKGQSVHLPTNPSNKLGYDIEFDKNGKYKHYQIDYVAMAAHIVALHKQAKKRGYDLWRVIFDPALQAGLFKTQYADYLKENIQLSKRKSWVRHDEHYHVDFSIPCEK